ncbi:MAG: OmpA family protein [Prevotellaceae bacterium]|jgi:outer membrane protein OmpA-like peptidoglycan-associated protein/tetratricopeptide (TPR) repeat protein|nr:OmpA family protein [Prevotellaceae bacterium]
MKKNLILLVTLILAANVLSGQNTKKADKAFSGGRYYEAIQEYNLLENKITDPQLLTHITFSIAESYRRMNQPERAESYFVKAIRGGYMLPDVYFGYGEVLLNLGKYDEAKKQFEIFKRSNPDNKLVDAKIASCDFAKAHRMENPKFKLQPMETLNTRGSEYGVAYFNDNLIYASTGNPIEDIGGQSRQQVDISPRTGLPYSKFYMSVLIGSTYNKGEPIVGLNKGSARKNEGTFAYDPVNNLGYYTRCTGEAKNEQCYIYFAEFKNNQWKEIDNLKIENRSEPVGHPFVTPDGKRIYFVSVMEGGYGKSDIWYTDKLPDGTWSKPINLGREINTSGNEMFPFVAGDYLFFSSDGHPGYGGMDIFASKIDGNIHGTSINLGLPFNSAHDDVNLIEKFDFSEGMLVSSRRSANNDDIFRFEGYPSALTASGQIYDSLTKQPKPGISIEVKKEGKLVEKLTSDENGNYVFYIDPAESAYELSASVMRYNPIARSYNSINERFAALQGWDLPLRSSDAYISGIITGAEKSRDGSTSTQLGPLANVKVEVFENGEAIKLLETDAKGQYRFGDIKENTVYKVKATVGKGDEFFADDKSLEVGEIPQSIEFCKATGYDMDIELIKITETIQLNNILYAYNKWDLLPESYIELDKLLTIMQKNPTLIIEIRSHTDSRGSTKYNQTLSEKRAASVVQYLIGKGIPPTRLASKGYGESQLRVKPERSEADYQANRRTEFTVTGTTGEALWDSRLTVTPSVDAYGVRQIQDGYQQPQYQPQQPVTQPPVSTGAGVNVKNLPYAIQIAAVTKPASMGSSDFVRIKQLFNLDVYEVYSNGVYRYYAGGFNSVEEARTMCDRVNRALGKSEKDKFFVKKK